MEFRLRERPSPKLYCGLSELDHSLKKGYFSRIPRPGLSQAGRAHMAYAAAAVSRSVQSEPLATANFTALSLRTWKNPWNLVFDTFCSSKTDACDVINTLKQYRDTFLVALAKKPGLLDFPSGESTLCLHGTLCTYFLFASTLWLHNKGKPHCDLQPIILTL